MKIEGYVVIEFQHDSAWKYGVDGGGVTLYRDIISTNIISTVRNHYLRVYVTRFKGDKVDTVTNLFSDQIYSNIMMRTLHSKAGTGQSL